MMKQCPDLFPFSRQPVAGSQKRFLGVWHFGCFLLVSCFLMILPASTYGEDSSAAHSGLSNITTPKPVSGVSVSRETIRSADVLARITLVLEAIEQIRSQIGRYHTHPMKITVTNSSPRDGYFQALTLVQKANRLSHELTGKRGPQPDPNDVEIDEIRPYHKWILVEAAYERLLFVGQRLKVKMPTKEKLQDPATTSDQVFQKLFEANRRLVNLMLSERIQSSDVFWVVSEASDFAADLLATFPGSAPPTEPIFVSGKEPIDNYRRLIECQELIESIAVQSGVHTATVKAILTAQDEVLPSDVFNFAKKILGDMAYFHALEKSPLPLAVIPVPPSMENPAGRKFPSHVYQRAGLLRHQLEVIQTLVRANPNWHKKIRTE